MFTWKDYLREKSMEELKEYRKKKIRYYIFGAFFMLIPATAFAVVISLKAVDYYDIEIASTMGTLFGMGMWFMDILVNIAQLSIINDAIREKKRKTINDFYGVTE